MINYWAIFRTTTPRIANMALRALAMGSKFFLVIFLARFLEPSEIGIYGLFASTVSLGILFIGLDYYTYSQREMLSLPKNKWCFVIQHQVVATGLIYLVGIPLHLIIFVFDLMPVALMFWFFSILISEHIAQEINRLLMAMQRPLMASFVLFVRMGAWAWVLIPAMWAEPGFRTLNAVFFSWFIGGIVSIVLGIFIIYFSIEKWHLWPMDHKWIIQGYKTCLIFLTATICFKTMLTADKYIVEYLVGPELLGVYYLFMGFALTVLNFLDPAVFAFLYPPLVAAYRQGDHKSYKRIFREMTASAIGLSIGIAITVAMLAPFALNVVGRPIYAEHLPILYLLLVMTVIYAAGMVFHYGLYAIGADRTILFSHISSLIVFGFVSLMLSKYTPLAAVCYGLIAAFSWMCGYKAWIYYRKCSEIFNTEYDYD